MQQLTFSEIDLVSGGNAQDTVTGSFVSGTPPQEAGLSNLPLIGLLGAFVGAAVRTLIRVAPTLL